MTEPTVTPEQARAQIDAIRNDPQSSYNRGDEAAVEHVQGLYVALHRGDTQGEGAPRTPGQTTAPNVSTLEAIEARLKELRSTPAHRIRDEEAHVDELLRLTRERDALRAQRGDGEQPPLVETISAPSLPPLPPQAGFEWDEAKITELRGVVEHEEVDARFVDQGLTLFAQLVGQQIPTVEETANILRSRWGREYETKLDEACEAWEALPKAVQQNLTETRVRYHPQFVAFMADVGERLLDPLTDRGMERQLKPYRS